LCDVVRQLRACNSGKGESGGDVCETHNDFFERMWRRLIDEEQGLRLLLDRTEDKRTRGNNPILYVPFSLATGRQKLKRLMPQIPTHAALYRSTVTAHIDSIDSMQYAGTSFPSEPTSQFVV
jgi:hypothetical protein